MRDSATENVRGPSEEASDAELPPILQSPPWLAKKRVPRPTFALKIAPIEREERVVLDPARARAALERRAAKLPTVPEEELLELFNGGEGLTSAAYVIARFGALAMSGIVHCAKRQSARDDPRWVLTGDSTRLAIAMLERDDDALPRLWFRRYPETTLHALLPIALSDDARSERAGRAISMLVREGHGKLAHRVAETYGKNVDEALGVWLAWDPHWDLPVKIPKMPSAWNPAALRRPTLRNGKALPLAAVGHIGTMLAMSTRAVPYVGLVDVKEACDPHSLAEFAWDCACACEMSSSVSQTAAWMRDVLVHFGDDEVVRRTTPAMKATNVIPVLEAIGTPAAVMELLTIEERTPSLSSLVSKALTEIAHQQGLEVDELVESVPIRASLRSVGAAVNGEITVRDAGQTLRIGFDSKLEAYVETEDGVRAYKHKFHEAREAHPHEARTVWNDLKEDVAVLAPRLLAGLERAMVSGRTWSMDAFRKRWLEDPVMRHLSGSLIWTDHGRPFRVALDGSFAGSLDEAITLTGEEVGILHPARVTAEERERWAALIGDYKLVQPFVQLALPVYTLPEAPDGDVYVLPIPNRPLSEVAVRLTSAGFAPSPKLKGLYTRGGTTITLADGDPVSSARVEWRVGTERIPLAKVDPVDASEALAPLSF